MYFLCTTRNMFCPKKNKLMLEFLFFCKHFWRRLISVMNSLSQMMALAVVFFTFCFEEFTFTQAKWTNYIIVSFMILFLTQKNYALTPGWENFKCWLLYFNLWLSLVRDQSHVCLRYWAPALYIVNIFLFPLDCLGTFTKNQ